MRAKFASGLPPNMQTKASALFRFDDVRFLQTMSQLHGTPAGVIASAQGQGIIKFNGLRLVDSGAEVNIETDLSKFVGYITRSTVS